MIDMKHLDEARAVLREAGISDEPTPWIGETAKRVREHGAYADYAGWKAWLDAEYPDLADAVDDMDDLVKTILYSAMCQCCRETAEAMGWRAEGDETQKETR